MKLRLRVVDYESVRSRRKRHERYVSHRASRIDSFPLQYLDLRSMAGSSPNPHFTTGAPKRLILRLLQQTLSHRPG
jgi:hypothetical protein